MGQQVFEKQERGSKINADNQSVFVAQKVEN
jgi:hypothetical protein